MFFIFLSFSVGFGFDMNPWPLPKTGVCKWF
jgi:hypothetical protein